MALFNESVGGYSAYFDTLTALLKGALICKFYRSLGLKQVWEQILKCIAGSVIWLSFIPGMACLELIGLPVIKEEGLVMWEVGAQVFSLSVFLFLQLFVVSHFHPSQSSEHTTFFLSSFSLRPLSLFPHFIPFFFWVFPPFVSLPPSWPVLVLLVPGKREAMRERWMETQREREGGVDQTTWT